MSSKKITVPKTNKGYGYAGVWRDGKMGWFAPRFVSGNNRRYPDTPDLANPHLKGERLFLCEITIKPLVDKKGRPITKIVK